MSDVYAPLAEYCGLPWNIYRRLWWERHPGTGTLFCGSNLTEVQRRLVDSALARGDEDTAEMFLRDWGRGPPPKPEIQVSKFVPGAHYHVLGTKFDTFDAAKRHAEGQGYKVTGLREVFVYTRGGD
jgi:hypothetical protein